ncbi:hypothetical protein E2C01_075845 [Portunus trituberculatus]|uniref:Uncharacterized protein n=1 Tax=Portunus trituberculatus TaxID=210409 RepID=A0A5B7IKF2_PORTR|nr:hypothetical protein [Portunus trituberculatus]
MRTGTRRQGVPSPHAAGSSIAKMTQPQRLLILLL